MIDVSSKIPPGGFLHGWLRYCEPYEFPDSYATYSLLAVASAAINGRILVDNGTPRTMPNIFVLLIGPSGSRKGGAMWRAQELLMAAVPETPLLPDDFSSEKLHSRLAAESAEKGECGGLIFAEEFSDLIGGADYLHRNTKTLSKLWDGRAFRERDTHKHGSESILNPYIVGLFATSPDWLYDVDPKKLAGGFLRRVMLVMEYKPKRFDEDSCTPIVDKDLFADLRSKFSARLGAAAFSNSRMVLSEDAKALMRVWYTNTVFNRLFGADEMISYFASTMQEHLLKLSAIVQLLEGGNATELQGKYLKVGIGLLDAILPNMEHAYQMLVPTPYARLCAAIVRAVKSMSNHGVKATELDRAVKRATGMKPRDVAEARDALLRDGTLGVERGRIVARE